MAPIQCRIPLHVTKHIDDILLKSLCIYLHHKIEHFNTNIWVSVTNLALGSQPKQKHGKVQAWNATWESHSHSQRM
jgi:hypothetical protein